MASNSFSFKNTKVVWMFQQFNFTPSPGDGSLSATMTFDFSEYGTNVQSFTYGIMGWNMVFNDYIKSYGIEPKVINWNQGDPQVQIQIKISADNVQGNIKSASGNWVKLVIIAYVDTNENDGFYFKNVPNLPNGDTTTAVATNDSSGTLNAHALLGGFQYSQGNSPFNISEPAIVSLSATAGLEKGISSLNHVNLNLNSTAAMVLADTSYYNELKTTSYSGSLDAGLLAIKNGLTVNNGNDNNTYILKAQGLSLPSGSSVDSSGNPVINMPSFGLNSTEYKLVQAITIFQSFQIGRQTGNLYENKNGSLYVDSWVTGDRKQITFGSYFSLVDPEGTKVWNRGTADILVIALFQKLPTS